MHATYVSLFVLTLAALFFLAAPAMTQDLRIDADASHVTYAMEHPAHAWSGTSHRVDGHLTVDDGRIVGGRVAVPIVSFDSGNRSRDVNMTSDTEAYLYPDVVFVAESVHYLDDAHAEVAGTLSFHGVTRPVTMPAEVEAAEDGVRLRGHFEVTLTEFDLKPPSFMLVKTRDWIGLDVEFVVRGS